MRVTITASTDELLSIARHYNCISMSDVDEAIKEELIDAILQGCTGLIDNANVEVEN